MKNTESKQYPYGSVFADMFREYVDMNRAVGKNFDVAASAVWRFDKWCVENGASNEILTRDVYSRWCEVNPNEKNTNHSARIKTMNRAVAFLREHGRCDFTPQPAPRVSRSFTPHIFTQDEIQRFFSAADSIEKKMQAPLAYKIYPLMFRMLYCCGMRVSEATLLRTECVDLDEGVLRILKAKHGKDRLVPMSESLTSLCRKYATDMLPVGSEYFFPSPDGGCLWKGTVYARFRDLLWKAGIPHGGRGKGPRLHDFRHSFAVHRLAEWSRNGIDIYATIKILSVYLGHIDLSSTQYYLRLTAEVFPELTTKFEAAFGDVFQEVDHEKL